jgi:hypothetical protein
VSVAGGDAARLFNHQDRAADRNDRSVQHPGRDGEGLARAKLDGLGSLKLDALARHFGRLRVAGAQT